MNHTDIKKNHWLINSMPVFVRPYLYLMRIDRPVGIWLLLWPCLWSICLAIGDISKIKPYHFYVMGLFAAGAVIMRGAGCVMNDIWDRDFDRNVARTQSRPIASGVVSVQKALVFLICLLALACLIALQLPPLCFVLACAVLPLIVIYPLMKRITFFPQIFLGIVFNFGALIGWAAIENSISLPVILLYIGAIFWTIGYDTIYAHQDIEDDLKIGVKSTAIKFGNQTKKWVAGFYVAAWIMFAAALFSQTLFILSVFIMLIPALHMWLQIRSWNLTEPWSALKIFKSNHIFGGLTCAVIILVLAL